MRTTLVIAVCVAAAFAGAETLESGAQKPAPAADPVLVMDTAKGPIEIRLFPADAPRSVEHILGLVRRNFYRGLRLHRLTPTIVQWGDPLSRDVSRKDSWGSGGSGTPIGVAEFSKRRTHQRGTVSLAHAGRAEFADSQLFILKAGNKGYDGKHVIIGQVTSGMGVVDKLAHADVIKNITIKP
jgi:cyclophilin family peptidyl-prolyl cis-trans isomerase